MHDNGFTSSSLLTPCSRATCFLLKEYEPSSFLQPEHRERLQLCLDALAEFSVWLVSGQKDSWNMGTEPLVFGSRRDPVGLPGAWGPQVV